jgi:hypothetical protein
MIVMTTGFDDFDNRIHDLVEQENERDNLFKEIKNGNGEKSLRYIALRDACKELRKQILRSAKSVGLTRERIETEIKGVENETIASNANQA